MESKKINVLDEILSDDFTELLGIKEPRSEYALKIKYLKNSVEKCYIDTETYNDLRERLDENAKKVGLAVSSVTPNEQRLKVNRLFFKERNTIKRLQDEGYTNLKIYEELAQKSDEFKEIDGVFFTRILKQATKTAKPMARKYDAFLDEIIQLLRDGNTPYYISKLLPQKYPDDDISWDSLGKYAIEVKKKMDDGILR